TECATLRVDWLARVWSGSSRPAGVLAVARGLPTRTARASRRVGVSTWVAALVASTPAANLVTTRPTHRGACFPSRFRLPPPVVLLFLRSCRDELHPGHDRPLIDDT